MKTPVFAIAIAFMYANLAHANSITDVGVGLVPDFDPVNGTTWNLSSSCVDINEAGQAACQARALGPTYRCGFRGIKTCGSKIQHVYRWDGSGLTLMSDPAVGQDVPLVINNDGDIGGYYYAPGLYQANPAGGDIGRIWSDFETPRALAKRVVSLNDHGQFVLQSTSSPGGILQHTATVHDMDGTEITFPGFNQRAFLIGNSGDVIAAQTIQVFVSETDSLTGNEIPEVSGVGWALTDQDVDAIDLDEAGLFNIDGQRLWPATYYRPMAFTNYETIAGDVNDHGDFVFSYRFGGLFSGYYCTPDGETPSQTRENGTILLPWRCDRIDYHAGTYAGGKAYDGINNHGDAVGRFTPGAYAYSSSYPSIPTVWLRNAQGSRDEYDANDLLPVDSGYTVLTVKDINDQRDVVGTCKNPAGETRGCIIHLTDIPVPDDAIKPFVRIDSLGDGDIVTGPVTVTATAFDDWSRIAKVVFKIDATRLKVDRSAPFQAELDPTGLAEGNHTIKAVAFDNAGNRKTAKVVVAVAGVVPAPAPTPMPGPVETPAPNPGPAPVGTEVEGEGTITAFGADSVNIDGRVVLYTTSTAIIFNEVSSFVVGLAIQYKGIEDADGTVTATDLEIN